jgi:hypothetical protein
MRIPSIQVRVTETELTYSVYRQVQALYDEPDMMPYSFPITTRLMLDGSGILRVESYDWTETLTKEEQVRLAEIGVYRP